MKTGRCIVLLCLPLSLMALSPDIEKLGAEAYKDREAAEKALRKKAVDTPYRCLQDWAKAYQETEDLEIRVRLRRLMEPLAMELMFDLPRGYMGIHLGEVTTDEGEPLVLVNSVIPGESASKAGLREGDLIAEVNGQTVKEMGGQPGFSTFVAAQPPGTRLNLVILRGNKEIRQPMTLGARRDEDNTRARQDRASEAQQRYRDWLLALEGKEDGDPNFPIGHFPVQARD